jgi:hypothetical protein
LVFWINIFVNILRITPETFSAVLGYLQARHNGPKVSAPRSSPENNASLW